MLQPAASIRHLRHLARASPAPRNAPPWRCFHSLRLGWEWPRHLRTGLGRSTRSPLVPSPPQPPTIDYKQLRSSTSNSKPRNGIRYRFGKVLGPHRAKGLHGVQVSCSPSMHAQPKRPSPSILRGPPPQARDPSLLAPLSASTPPVDHVSWRGPSAWRSTARAGKSKFKSIFVAQSKDSSTRS